MGKSLHIVPAFMVLSVLTVNLSAQTRLDSLEFELEPVVVTASHSPKALKDAPVVTRLITLRDIKLTDATNIQDMLTQEIPGLEFGFAMGQETSLNMSGFGGNAVLFLLDGERMAGETMDNVDYNRMSLDNVGRIEIVKGASSALYGSNAVGGVINIISRENLEPWTANVNSRYNSFGHEWRNGASFSFNTKKWNSQTSFQHTKIDPVNLPKAHSAEEIAAELLKKAQGLPYDESVLEDDANLSRLYGQKTYNIKERLIWRTTDNLTLTGRAGYFYRTSERDTYDYHFNSYSAGLKGKYAWNQNRSLELSYAYDQYDKANYMPDGTRTHDHDYSNRQHVAHALFSQSFGKNNLIVGADFMHDYLTTYQFIDNAGHSQNNIDGYAQFDWNITPQLNIVGSMRYDYYSASAQKALTERLAVVYKFPWMTLRANYASGFRAPTLKEMYMHFDMGNMGYMIIGNPDLKPEKSHNINLAIERQHRIQRGGFFDGSYSFTLMGYCNIFDKRITTIDGGLYQDMESALYWNEEGVTVWGIDLSLGYVMKNGLSLKYNYSWMRETGNVIYSQFSQPRSHSMTWRLGYSHRFSRHYALDAALSGRNLGKPQSGHTNVDQGYSIWKLMLQHHIWRGVHLNTAIDNLFNYKPRPYYYSSPLTTGTSFSIGLSIDINDLIIRN
ncbi:MAG: TonB-dependent receptor [Bacteroidaceae bacterium]|nr:TonB-dependent receptor [Bacteroidaceae bacterium]